MPTLFPVFDNITLAIRTTIIAANETLVIVLLGESQRSLGVVAIVQDFHPFVAIAKAPPFVAEVFDLQIVRVVFNTVLNSRGPMTVTHSDDCAGAGKRKH
jgi:hypothetical protein